MMKKSIFAVAVASALTLTAAHAETVLYGSIRYDYQNKKEEQLHSYTDAAGNQLYRFEGKRLSNLEDEDSRIGIRGSEDLGNGTSVIYQLEWGFDGMSQESSGFHNCLAYMGLTGNWGTFTAGRQDNPFKVTIVDDAIVDDFNAKSAITSASQRAMTSILNGSELARIQENATDPTKSYLYEGVTEAEYSRVGKVIAYTTPNFAGFSANVALMMDSELYGKNDEKNIDLWTINAKYAYDFNNNGTLLAKAGYIQGKLKDENRSKAWGLFLGYKQDAFGVTAAYTSGNHRAYGVAHTNSAGNTYYADGAKEKSQGWDVGASYSFGPNYFSTVRLNYGENQTKVDGAKDKVKSWAVGFEQKLSTRTRAWVEYGSEDAKYNNRYFSGNPKQKSNVISVGMRHDF